MKFFNDFERKYRKYAIPDLMKYITVCYGAGLVLWLWNPMFYLKYLSLDPAAIMHGQVWRLVTFLIFPPALGNWRLTSPFIGVIGLFMYYSLGQTLERVWGAFRFNVFFFAGVLGQILAAMVAYLVFRQPLLMTTGFLNFSIFLAFAIYFPDVQFYLFFVLPIKAKWLAVAECAVYLYSFIFGNISTRVELVISLANVIVFFLMTRNFNRYAPKEIKRKNDFKKNVKIRPQGATRHKCAVCGRTEFDDENLEFRYCSKCEGNYEYCQDHLYTHQHVTADGSPPQS